MSRTSRQTRLVLTAIGWLIVAAVFTALASRTAARPPVPQCWWDGTTLHAVDLPDEWAVTFDRLPVGVSAGPSTYETTFSVAVEAVFWTRGGPYDSVFRPPRQYRDYRAVCVASP